MSRAEWRRKLSDERKNKNVGPLASNVRPVYAMTPEQIKAMKSSITDDVIKSFGGVDNAAIELAKKQAFNEGYDAGYDDGFDFAKDHFLTLQYICMGLAIRKRFGFASKRIYDIWNTTNEIYAEIVERQNNGEDLDVLETEYNWKLYEETGLKLDLDGYEKSEE